MVYGNVKSFTVTISYTGRNNYEYLVDNNIKLKNAFTSQMNGISNIFGIIAYRYCKMFNQHH